MKDLTLNRYYEALLESGLSKQDVWRTFVDMTKPLKKIGFSEDEIFDFDEELEEKFCVEGIKIGKGHGALRIEEATRVLEVLVGGAA